MTTPGTIDSRLFRDVMGCFATGVTVVTVSVDGKARGMTANAVTSVSLDPPLLLVSVARTASIFPLFEEAESFAVSILAGDQRDLSDLFSHAGDVGQPAASGRHRTGTTGAPIIEDAIAYADCNVYARYDGGDHVLVLGEVVETAVQRGDTDPLLFFRGKYRQIAGLE